MTLRFEPDTSYADWWATRGEPWERLCSVGPSGFEDYARIFFWLEPETDPTSDRDVSRYEGPLPTAELGALCQILTGHTSTPEDCFFGLWEGGGYDGERGTAPGEEWRIPPTFSSEVMTGPRFHIPNRAYWLFRGRLDESADWGTRQWPPGTEQPVFGPQLLWPADKTWFFADEIDVPWVVIGGSRGLVNEILRDDRFDAARIRFGENLSYHRRVVGPGRWTN